MSNFLCKGPDSIFGFMANTVFVSTTQLQVDESQLLNFVIGVQSSQWNPNEGAGLYTNKTLFTKAEGRASFLLQVIVCQPSF